jgi:predicted RNA-binding Zn ribbon-like protein
MITDFMDIDSRANKFRFVGGVPILDFVNTVSARVDRPGEPPERNTAKAFRTDKFVDFVDLLAWTKRSGLLGKGEIEALARKAVKEPASATTALRRFIQFREVVYRLFKAALDNRAPAAEDLKTFNKELRNARKHENLAYRENGFEFEWEGGQSSFYKLFWILVRSAADLLTSAELAKIGQCRGQDCGWLFVDISRGGTRAWCDMKDCGNLAKVRRFRSRQKATSL